MKKDKFLLHICCAPCSGLISQKLKDEFDLTVYFDNSNIYPQVEFEKRMKEAKDFFKQEKINFILNDYNHQAWLKIVKDKNLEKDEEKGRRCKLCYYLRLKQTVEFAIQNDFTYFSTSLVISPYKDKKSIFNIAKALAVRYDLKFFEHDFSEDSGYLKSVEFSKINNFYRQKYCGCEFSDKSVIIR